MTTIEVLQECREYFEQRADAEYFSDSPTPSGNEEMRLLVMVEQAVEQMNRAERKAA